MTTQAISSAFPYSSKYVKVHGSNIHYVEQGAGDPILFLHGNPTSSYLWRNIIPHVSGLGRVLAMDLIGMGRSDKPDLEYRFVDHAKYVEGFIEQLGLTNLTLVIHDWGSALGFHYARRHASNVKGIAFLEAILFPVPSWDQFLPDFPEVRQRFRNFRTPEVGWDLIVNHNVFVEQVLPGGVVRKLTEEELDQYREPFREPASRKPVWRWPNEIPIEGDPADVTEVVTRSNEWLQRADLPKLLFHGKPGALMPAPLVEWCKTHLQNLKTVDVGPGSHFLQEDNPHLIGTELADWYRGMR